MTSTRVLQADFTEGVLTTPNYVPNSTFELNGTDGWNLYNDGAVAVPVDGIGGTVAGLTMTAVSSTIRGNFVGRLTKDAANRIGNGVAIDLKPLAPVDLTKPLSISVEFNAGTNFVAGDVVAYVYDITGAALISGLQLSVSNGRGVLQGFFIPNTASANYRLVFHIATVNALGWTLDLDSVLVGPQARGTSAAITDWQSYTPVFGGLGSVTNVTFKYRQVGANIEVEGRFTTGTPTAIAASITLPSGLVTRTVASNTVRIGEYIRDSATANQAKTGHLVCNNNTGLLFFVAADFALATNPFNSATGTFLFAGTEIVYVNISVPIEGWSSNTFSANNALTEYASNTDTANTDTTASGFYNGADGAVFGSYSGTTRTKRVRFATPYNVTDRLVLVATHNGNKFAEISVTPFQSTSGTTGISYVRVLGSDTDFDVLFGSAGLAATLTGGGGGAWSLVANNSQYRWRLVKISAGGDALLPIGSRNIVADTTGTPIPAQFVNGRIQVNFSNAAFALGSLTNVAQITLPKGSYNLGVSAGFNPAASATGVFGTISTTTASSVGVTDGGQAITLITAGIAAQTMNISNNRKDILVDTTFFFNLQGIGAANNATGYFYADKL